jgi:catechol 2,3-dioxygenase-like lactoylglutathione lyase family enzyme
VNGGDLKVDAITLFVGDPQRSKAFYTKAFGLASIFEDDASVVFRFENVVVNLLAVAAAPELVDPAPVGDADTGRRFALTVPVEDVDAACAELANRGVELLNGPMDRPWGIRTASFTDPDGHVWEIAQPLDS